MSSLAHSSDVQAKRPATSRFVAKPQAAQQAAIPQQDAAALAAEQLRRAEGSLPPKIVSPQYRAAMALVAAGMLALPVVYLALIALVAAGLGWYAVHATGLFDAGGSSRDLRGAVLAYLGPLVAGGVLLLFMVKPLFVRRRRDGDVLSLTRADEPRLFEFVARLCRLVGAPEPVRIDVDCRVNASASFRRGLLSLFRRDLVLTIGLPLAAGLDLRQFAAVLAHEFGHFSQRGGMRMTFLVNAVNVWFARVVYERDEWDRRLAVASRQGYWLIVLVALLTSACVWLTRRVLWCLMVAGRAISSLMSRQMEFDADQYAVRVSGASAFAEMTRRLPVLAAAEGGAFHDLSTAWTERRLGDDFPLLVMENERQMPADVRGRVRKADDERRAGWFDSHPTAAARIAAAEKLGDAGVFTATVPAATRSAKAVVREAISGASWSSVATW